MLPAIGAGPAAEPELPCVIADGYRRQPLDDRPPLEPAERIPPQYAQLPVTAGLAVSYPVVIGFLQDASRRSG